MSRQKTQADCLGFHNRNNLSSHITGVILAGGKSQRMGCDKCFVPLGGVPMVKRAYNLLAPHIKQTVIVTNKPDEVAALGWDRSVSIATDKTPHAGPLAGILSALDLVSTPWIFVRAADMPWLAPGFIDLLTGYLNAKNHKVDGVICHSHKGYEPLCALYSADALRNHARAISESPRRRVSLILDYLDMAVVPEQVYRRVDPHGDSFVNINHPYQVDVVDKDVSTYNRSLPTAFTRQASLKFVAASGTRKRKQFQHQRQSFCVSDLTNIREVTMPEAQTRDQNSLQESHLLNSQGLEMPVKDRVVEQIEFDEARRRVLDLASVLDSEEVPFMDALGRVLAQDLVSDIDVSPFDNSAMDGFALRAQDLHTATDDAPVALRVVEVIPAGHEPQAPVGTGECARIMTGAVMPQGTDTVVKIEDTSAFNGGGELGEKVLFFGPQKNGMHVRRRGEEVAAGEIVLHAGDRIKPASVGLMAATGNSVVSVYRRPLVGILATGSELVDVDEKPGPGKIRNSNTYTLAAQVTEAGGIAHIYNSVTDTYEGTRDAFQQAARECDILITSGGVSVGDFDFVKAVLAELGELFFCKVKMRPGNPQVMGKIGDTLFFGLPGNPSSCFVGFEVFLRPMIRKMQGFTTLDRPRVFAKLVHATNKKQVRRYFDRGRVFRDSSGVWRADISSNQSSALLTAAHKGNAFVVLPDGAGLLTEGTKVECWLLDGDESLTEIASCLTD